MPYSRRRFIQHSALTAAALAFPGRTLRAQAADKPVVDPSEIAPGPFTAEMTSLRAYQYPDWFRDAKLGFWAHWGPQAVPRQGDWYARKMYISMILGPDGTPKYPHGDYLYHVKHYGPPSKFGYKDLIKLWKAEKWDPDGLMALYKKTGAKYFVSMGCHHDNFCLYNSQIHRWNAVKLGPQKDVVGLWQKAAQNNGLRFGVSEHLAYSYGWFQTSHGSDYAGPLKGVPYDGADPQYQDLYHPPAPDYDQLKQHMTQDPKFFRDWFVRTKELVDSYAPDLLYSDCGLPFGEVGLSLIANHYNRSAARNGGKVDVVYNCKQSSPGYWVQDLERGRMKDIQPHPWQTDTSIGDWFYSDGQKYKSGTEVVQMLVDIISKNGNLLINIVQTPEGDLEPDVMNILAEIGAWTAPNGEAVYGSRPWKIAGEGPSMSPAELDKIKGRSEYVSYTAQDIRFTAKGNAVYVFCLGTPTADVTIQALGTGSPQTPGSITDVELLGSKDKVTWNQSAAALTITKASVYPFTSANTFKVTLRA